MAHLFLRRDETVEQREDAFDARQDRARSLTCYTDAFIIRGTLQGAHRRLTDALNAPDEPFLVLEDVTFEEFRTGAVIERASFAQVNLSTVLFAYESGDELPTPPELRSVKVQQSALVNMPPFRVVGQLHLLPERSLRIALRELLGRFIPVTDATFWSDSLGIPRTAVAMLAFNHARSQILAPFATPEGEGSPA